MIPETNILREQLAKAQTMEGKVALLKGRYFGRRCFMLSCGPSLNQVPHDQLRGALKDELVIAVKQAYNVVPGIADFHLLNSTSYQRYSYVDPAPIVLLERGADDAPIWGCRPHITFAVTGNDRSMSRERRLANRLTVKRNFDDYLFDRTLNRPWGPGVILELGLYLALHLGIRELIVMGWDLGPPDQTIYHHYYERSAAWAQGALGLFGRRLARRGPFIALQWLRHIRGKTYNHGTVERDDTAVSVDSSFETYEWLLGHGLKLSLLSSQSYLDPRIPRAIWPVSLDAP